jgi:hypothetical protein
MNYLPYIVGGAALGLAARRGHRARHDEAEYEWARVKGSFRRQTVEGPWGTKTMQVSTVWQRRRHGDVTAFYLKEPTQLQRGWVRHQGFSYDVQRGYDYDFRDLPWRVQGEGRQIESTRLFDATQQAAADAWVLDWLTPSQWSSHTPTTTVNQTAMDLAEMREMGNVPLALSEVFTRHGGYWPKLSSKAKKQWTTEARASLRRLERAGKIVSIPSASPATWKLR